jgi:hypothetical protein
MMGDNRKANRVRFDHKHTVSIIGIDGTWRRSCILLDASESGAKLEVEGSIAPLKGKRDFPRTLTPAVLMDCPSIGRYRAVQAVAALWKLKGSRSVISASPAR